MVYDGADWLVCDSDFTPSVGQWYHVCGTYNATAQQSRIYIDTVLKKSTNYSAAVADGTTLRIGGWTDATPRLNGRSSRADGGRDAVGRLS